MGKPTLWSTRPVFQIPAQQQALPVVCNATATLQNSVRNHDFHKISVNLKYYFSTDE